MRTSGLDSCLLGPTHETDGSLKMYRLDWALDWVNLQGRAEHRPRYQTSKDRDSCQSSQNCFDANESAAEAVAGAVVVAFVIVVVVAAGFGAAAGIDDEAGFGGLFDVVAGEFGFQERRWMISMAAGGLSGQALDSLPIGANHQLWTMAGCWQIASLEVVPNCIEDLIFVEVVDKWKYAWYHRFDC